MNKLLLTTALVAVSGAAVAEITWSGDAEFGWNTHVSGITDVNGDLVSNDDVNDAIEAYYDSVGMPFLYDYDDVNGLYFEAGLDATGTAELDNGVTASITYGINLDYNVEGDPYNEATDIYLDDFPTVKIESSIATLTIGDVDHAAHDIFVDAGSMDVGFTEADGELVGRVDTTLAGQTIGISYQASNKFGDVANNLTANGFDEKWDILSAGAAGEFSSFKYTAGYEQGKHFTTDALMTTASTEDYTIWGLGAGFEYSGATVGVAIAQHEEADVTARSYAIGAEYEMANGLGLTGALSWNDANVDDDVDQVMGYEVGATFNAMGADVSLGYEDSNTDDDVDGDFTADAKYDMGNGIVGYVGYDSGEANVIDDKLADEDGAFYAGVEYALGNGAQLVLSHAQFDEAGDPEFKAGTTLAVTLDF